MSFTRFDLRPFLSEDAFSRISGISRAAPVERESFESAEIELAPAKTANPAKKQQSVWHCVGVVEGCLTHGVAASAVVEQWDEVERLQLRCGVCPCCAGPSRPDALACRWCGAPGSPPVADADLHSGP